MKEVNIKKFTLLKEYLIESDWYTIERFLKENNLFKKAVWKSDGSVMLECPFHDDRNPSFSLDSRNDLFRCFSCGAHGRFINFLQAYYKSQGIELNIYEVAERLLKRDKLMQDTLGFSTIFQVMTINSFGFDTEDLIIKRDYKLKESVAPLSYKLLANKVKKLGIEEQVLFIKLMQDGRTPEDIRKELL